MELIDKRALMYQLHKQSQIDSKPRAIRRARRIVEECPTVDAIPVNWLTNLAKEYEESDNQFFRMDSCVLEDLIKRWKEEQEKTNENR